MRREELFDKKSSLQNVQDCKGKSPHICRYSINFSVCFLFFFTHHACVGGSMFVGTLLCVFGRETMDPSQNKQFKK